MQEPILLFYFVVFALLLLPLLLFQNRLRTVENDKNILQTQFDTNAISPGTTFMVNFEKYLMEYLSNKAKHHANWQNCEILVSGSSVCVIFCSP